MKKLLKWEFRATSRQIVPLYLVLGGMTVLGVLYLLLYGVLENSDTGKMVLGVLTPLALLTFIFTIAAVSVGTFGILLFRYYRNLIRDEGYLMHTLPVTPAKLVLSKFIAAYVWMVLSVVLILLSVLILAFAAAVSYGEGIDWGHIWQVLVSSGIFEGIIPFLLAVLMSGASGILLFYAAISIGQCITRHKVAGAVGAYFGLYTALQIINMIMMIVYFIIVAKTDVLWEINFQVSSGSSAFSTVNSSLMTPFMIMITLLYAIYSVVFYMISKYMLTKKLNLE